METSSDTALTRSDDDPALRSFFSPNKATFRFMGLGFMCFLGFGAYFCYDNPAALQDNFKTDLHMSTSKFVILYSVYSWPNVLMCFVGGFLLDRVFGIRWGTIIYMGLTLAGQALFAAGAYINAFWLMLLGRFVFGIGAESLAVAQNSYAVLWFKGKELNMVFGLQLSFARLGSAVNFNVMGEVYEYVSKTLGYTGPSCIGIVLLLAALTCLGSMICALFLGLMDSHAEKVLKRNEGQEPKIVKFTDVKDFRPIFWLVAGICVSYYIAIFPFISLGKVYFIRKYAYDPATANKVTSLVYSISAIASPIFGILIDKSGRNVLWVILSIIGTLIAHGLLAFTYSNPYVCMALLGLSYSLLAGALWPLISLVIPEHQLGSAYGMAQALQNFGLAVTSMGCGMIVDHYGYFILELFFLGWLWVSLITAVVIWICDSNYTGYLNMSPKQREQKLLAGGGSTSDLSGDDLLQPQSDTQMRNRYLSRIGAEVTDDETA
ncbi:major facilitator superfamily domain-containing protein 1 isoform X2 [Copidosoma floridanum]|uniref:major facilitator superfamily domain-containing protein 1 isoform X2 n=1 Tax=Copidosoma floridanum TaxID=29053 RepID=UPI000C6FBB1E|nr:major facilitator superfamily domain-containing protein 1 isoform X2 [Copidosoma floridanum]